MYQYLQSQRLIIYCIYSSHIYNHISIIEFPMNSRINNLPSYQQNKNPRFAYSNVSKGFGLSTRNPFALQDTNRNQLQLLIEEERNKFRLQKNRLEEELDHERKVRIEFENKLIKIKDQFSRRDVSKSELQFQNSNLIRDNQDVCSQNNTLKQQLCRLEELYTNKITQLQTQIKMQSQNFDQTTLQYNLQFEKFKKEGQQYVEQLTFQFERKIKNIEDKNKNLEAIKRDLSHQNKKLTDVIVTNKLAFEQEIRDIKNKLRDQDIKKSQQLNRSIELKLKTLQGSKQTLVRKHQQLLRALQEKERTISDLQTQKQEQILNLRQQCRDLTQQNNHLSYLLTNTKQQLQQKQSLVANCYHQNDSEVQVFKQQLELKKQENSQLSSNIRELRSNFKQAESDWERKKRDLIQHQMTVQNQARKYKEEYLRICEILKSKINSAIDNVSLKK